MCTSTDFCVVFREAWALFMPSSISLMASSESFSPDFGLEAVSTFSTSASASLRRCSSSTIKALPLISFSPDAAAFLCLASSANAVLRRAWSLVSCTPVSPCLGPRALVAMTFLASVQAVSASFSAAVAFSPAAVKDSVVTASRSSEEKIVATCPNAFTFFSPVDTASTTSASMAADLRSAVSFLKLASLPAAASARACRGISSSLTALELSLEKRFASASFVLMKVLARFIAASASAAAASDSPMALVDSSGGSTSMPFKNGISASWHLCKDCSAASTFSLASPAACWAVRPSRCPLSVFCTSSILPLS
mmetsp:Transcript_9163/g.20222  ORF Transcript_9163/g.20222 Transcript_9163/m.20222 type:complete len:310 (-) Transcript_9163:1907-2836(-)